MINLKKLNNKGFTHVELIGLIVVVVAIVAVGAHVLLQTHAATPVKNNNHQNSNGGNTSSIVTVNVSPTSVTWGNTANDTITTTASGLNAGAKYTEQVKDLSTGQWITGSISFTATSSGGIPTPFNIWEMNDPYNCSQTDPPTYSGNATNIITDTSGKVVGQGMFTILPGDNSKTAC